MHWKEYLHNSIVWASLGEFGGKLSCLGGKLPLRPFPQMKHCMKLWAMEVAECNVHFLPVTVTWFKILYQSRAMLYCITIPTWTSFHLAIWALHDECWALPFKCIVSANYGTIIICTVHVLYRARSTVSTVRTTSLKNRPLTALSLVRVWRAVLWALTWTSLSACPVTSTAVRRWAVWDLCLTSTERMVAWTAL